MAFQVGTRVRPELGDADYSGFVRAAEIRANTLAQLGAAIGGAIEKHQEKKIKKQEEQVSLQALKSLFPQLDDDTAKAVVRDEVVRDLFKSTLRSEQTSPISPAALGAADKMLTEQGFEFNPETGTMQRQEGPGFFGSIGNFFAPGQPFTPEPVELDPRIVQGIKGVPELIETKRIMQGQESMSGTVLMKDREGRTRKVSKSDVEEAIANGYTSL
tara:strand:+ start:2513 stop:3157 length:645 start_codon:yes stop_codon:yes gene_type:complete